MMLLVQARGVTVVWAITHVHVWDGKPSTGDFGRFREVGGWRP